MVLSLVFFEVALRGYDAARKFLAPDTAAQSPPVPLHLANDSPVLYALNPEHPDISSQGLRDDEAIIPKSAGTFRILVLGDSVAYGSSVPRGDTFSNRLERRLREQAGAVEVINAGVMGYTPYNELQYYLSGGKEFGADLVVIAFCMNDVANPRLHWGDAPGVKIPPEAIPNQEYDREHVLPRVRELEEEKARPQSPGAGAARLLRHSRLYRALGPSVERVLRGKPKNFADTGARVPTYITGEDTLGIEVLLDRNTPEWRWLASIYDRLNEAVRGNGATMVIAVFPLVYQLDEGYPFFPQERISEYCRERSIPCLDLLPVFKSQRKEDIFVLDKEGHDDIWHLTDAGHALSAEEIQKFLREQGLLPVEK
ncbi:MAG: SGNH/GDSL hydrolase family protein [Pyrinomonadaceae bacterium]